MIEVSVTGWSSVGSVQLTFPLSSVVPLQVCGLLPPEPTVKFTTWLLKGVSGVGVFVVSVAPTVGVVPLTADVGPV